MCKVIYATERKKKTDMSDVPRELRVLCEKCWTCDIASRPTITKVQKELTIIISMMLGNHIVHMLSLLEPNKNLYFISGISVFVIFSGNCAIVGFLFKKDAVFQ